MEKAKTIVIDDEKLSADGLRKMLGQTGLDVEVTGVFYSSTDAIEFLKKNKVDLVITDINMPQISGLDLISQLKQLQNRANVIIITGFGSLKYAQEAMRYGVKHFLEKPCSIAELKESVNSCLKDISRQNKEELLANKEKIEEAIFGEKTEDSLEQISFSMLMYQDIFYDIIDVQTKEIFENLKVKYISGGIRDVMAYYIFSDLPKSAVDSLEGFSIPAIISYQESLSLKNVQAKFESGKKLLDYSFYCEKSVVVRESVNLDLTIYERLPEKVRRFKKNMKENNFTIARENLVELFESSHDSYLPPIELKNIVASLGKEMSTLFELADVNEEWLQRVLQAEFSKHLLGTLLEIVDQVELKVETNLTSNKISANLNLMIEKYFDNSELSLRWISKNILFLNPEYLGKVYLKETGEKFSAKLQEVRLKKAAEFLNEGFKIYEVAKMTGYENNPNYFGKLFRQRFGVTPREYRKRDE